MSLGIHFPILLCQTNRQYLVWWTVSVTQKFFTGLRQTWWKEWMHASLNAVDISNTEYNFASDFNVIYFWQIEHVSGMGCMTFRWLCTFLECTKSTKCYGMLKAISRLSLQKFERWRNKKKLLEEINNERLTAGCVREKIKIIRIGYSQELNRIMKSKKFCAVTNYLYKPQLVWFDFFTWFLWDFPSSEANSS
jgi:hypothetical protein